MNHALTQETLALLRCPACETEELVLSATRRPSVSCTGCQRTFEMRDGILRMSTLAKKPGSYRSSTISNWIAGMYDYSAPFLSAAVWNCSPVRYMDHMHRALGRANGGVMVTVPIATGNVVDYALAEYHDVTIIGIDSSINMLKQAQRRFKKSKQNVLLIHADPTSLPVRTGVADVVQSLNGLHMFDDRVTAINEWKRIKSSDGLIFGATIVRGQERIADTVLDQYEAYGMFPMLRTVEYVVEEMNAQEIGDVHFETHGAIAFFTTS